MRETNAAVERELDSLLRGEIAAAETYRIAIDRIDNAASAATLRTIQDDHGDAIRYLYEQVSERGVEPSTHSGPWGSFARAVEGAAAMIGDKTALAALREGELRGLQSYEDALKSGVLPAEVQTHVQEILVPRQHDHVDRLQQLIEVEQA